MAVMPGITETMFGMPKSPIFIDVLPTGDSSRCSMRFFVTMSRPQNVKKIVTSMPLPSAAQPMIRAGYAMSSVPFEQMKATLRVSLLSVMLFSPGCGASRRRCWVRRGSFRRPDGTVLDAAFRLAEARDVRDLLGRALREQGEHVLGCYAGHRRDAAQGRRLARGDAVGAAEIDHLP